MCVYVRERACVCVHVRACVPAHIYVYFEGWGEEI